MIVVAPVVVTYARQHVVILLFQPQGRSDTVLATSLWQDRPPGILFQHRYAAAILHPRSVVIWKQNCLSGWMYGWLGFNGILSTRVAAREYIGGILCSGYIMPEEV